MYIDLSRYAALLCLLVVSLGAPSAAQPEGSEVSNETASETWLTNPETGERYRLAAIEKREGGYRWIDRDRGLVRFTGGMTLEVESEDEDTFWVRVYESRRIERRPNQSSKPAAPPTEYRLANRTRALQLVPSDEGLPQSGLWREGLDLADFDGDGDLDLVLPPARKSARPQPSIFLRSNARWSRWSPARFPPGRYDYGSVAALDVNQDGALDLALAMHGLGVRVLLGDGQGVFRAAPASFFDGGTFRSRALEIIDWNQDGNSDLAAFGEGMHPGARPDLTLTSDRLSAQGRTIVRGLRVWLAGSDGMRLASAMGGEESSFGFGDDLVAFRSAESSSPSEATNGLLLASHRRQARQLLVRPTNGGSGSAHEVLDSLPARAVTTAVAAGELISDESTQRSDELVVGYRVRNAAGDAITALDLYRSLNGGWQRTSLHWELGQHGVWALDVGDLDLDGDLDIAAGTGDGRLWLLLQNEERTFELQEIIDGDTRQSGCVVRDLRISAPKSATSGHRPLLIALFSGEPTGTSSTPSPFPGCANGGRVGAWHVESPQG